MKYCSNCPHFSCSESVACCSKYSLTAHYTTTWEFRWLKCPDELPNATLTWDQPKGGHTHAQ